MLLEQRDRIQKLVGNEDALASVVDGWMTFVN